MTNKNCVNIMNFILKHIICYELTIYLILLLQNNLEKYMQDKKLKLLVITVF